MNKFKLGLLTLLTCLAITACGNRPKSNEVDIREGSSAQANVFSIATYNSCNARYNNKKFCNCFTEIMNDVTPHSLKIKSSNVKPESDVVTQLSSVMAKNGSRLSLCNKYLDIKKTNKAILNTAHTLKVVQQHKNNILTPSNVNGILPLDKPTGFEMKFSQQDSPNYISYRLARIDGTKSYFDYMLSEGRVQKEKYLLDAGVQFIHIMHDNNSEYRIRGVLDYCRFKLGRCSAISSIGRNQEILVEFQDGVWYYSYSKFRTKITEVVIYDLYGFPLYRKYHIHGRTSHIENVRIID